MESLFNESDVRPDVIRQVINTLPSDSLVNMIDQVNKCTNSDYRYKFLSHKLFPAFLNDIYELRLKVNQTEAFAKSLCAYLLGLAFPDDLAPPGGRIQGNISWRNLSKSLSSAAVRAGEMRAQQEAQQMIQNIQQQANQAIQQAQQQAQQQAMQAQGGV